MKLLLRYGRSRHDGFLLVEALTAMAISALLLIALGSLIGLVLKASDRAGRNGDEIEEASRVLSAVTREIETISPQRWAGKDAGFVFEGSHDRLVFARKVNGKGNSTDIHLVTLTGGPGSLVQTDNALPPTAAGLAEVLSGDEQTVTQSRFRVAFAFFSQLVDGQEALTDTWPPSAGMPVAIRVSLLDPQNRPWSSVRILLPIDAESGCAAPGRGLCSLAPIAVLEQTAEDTKAPDQKPVDADDALGWSRYLKR